MATGYQGPLALNDDEQKVFNSEVGDIDAEIKQRRQNPREPQPITFPIDVPLTVSSKIVENIRLHYKAAWGVQATADGDVWRLDFRCHE